MSPERRIPDVVAMCPATASMAIRPCLTSTYRRRSNRSSSAPSRKFNGSLFHFHSNRPESVLVRYSKKRNNERQKLQKSSGMLILPETQRFLGTKRILECGQGRGGTSLLGRNKGGGCANKKGKGGNGLHGDVKSKRFE